MNFPQFIVQYKDRRDNWWDTDYPPKRTMTEALEVFKGCKMGVKGSFEHRIVCRTDMVVYTERA